MSKQVHMLHQESNQGFARVKMLGALAAGALLGLLAGLPCGQEGNALALCQVVQTVVALGVPISVWIGGVRRQVGPDCLSDAAIAQGILQTCV